MRFRGSGRWSLMLLALAVAMMWLAGFPQLSLLACILLGVYALTGILWNARRVGLGASGHRAGLLLLFAVVGLLLASVQILPTVELMRHAGHQDRGSEDLLGERFRWPGYVGLLFPETLGDPMQAAGDWRADHGTWVALAEAAPDGTVGPPGVMNWGERTLYPGVLVLVLSLFGLFRRFGRRTASIAVVAFAGLSMASMPIVIRALAGLPGLGVGAPARAVALLAVAIPALAAFGFDAILDGAWRIGRRRGRTVTISALVLAVLVIAMLTSLWFREDAWIETGVGVLQDLGVAEKFGVEPREPAAWVEEFRPAFGRLRGDLLRLALVLGAAGALCLLDYRRGGRPVLLSAGIPLLVLADLLSFLVPVNLPVSRDGLFEATPSLTWLREHAGDGRFLRVASDAQSAASDADRLYPPNLGMLERLHDVQGYRELVPRRYLDYWR
jgi:hypothetical protein